MREPVPVTLYSQCARKQFFDVDLMVEGAVAGGTAGVHILFPPFTSL